MSLANAGQDVVRAIADVRERIAAACERAGRSPDGVTLVGATKLVDPEHIAEAYEAGLRVAGENRIQEALPKVEALEQSCPGLSWHFIGHLQRNKARAAAETFDFIHSVDSATLLHALERHAPGPLPVFVQVNIAGEASKGGVAPGDVAALVGEAGSLERVQVVGLMAVPPEGAAEDARPWFRALRELAREHGLSQLSMGMSMDYEVAIEEGATHVRLGRTIFGERRQ